MHNDRRAALSWWWRSGQHDVHKLYEVLNAACDVTLPVLVVKQLHFSGMGFLLFKEDSEMRKNATRRGHCGVLIMSCAWTERVHVYGLREV